MSTQKKSKSVKKNLARYLRKHKTLVLKGVFRGGELEKSQPNPKCGNPGDLPCNTDFSRIIKSDFENAFFLTIKWIDKYNNGTCFFQLDESGTKKFSNNEKIYREDGVCFVNKNHIIFNEIDNVKGFLTIDSCGCITLTRNRYDDEHSKIPFINSASNIKISCIKERNKVLKCE